MILIFLLIVCLLILLKLIIDYKLKINTSTNACVLVLGDIGRSPRMQYHATSLTRLGFSVSLVGMEGSKPHKSILENSLIKIHAIEQFEQKLPQFYGIFKVFTIFLKVFYQFGLLAHTLLTIPKTRVFLIQTPPAIPTIFIARIAAWYHGAELVIDWHNLGYSIMALGIFRKIPGAIRFAAFLEHLSALLGDEHISVMRGFSQWLHDTWKIDVVTHYDEPAAIFKPRKNMSDMEIHKLWLRLQNGVLESTNPDFFNKLMQLDEVSQDFQNYYQLEKEGKKNVENELDTNDSTNSSEFSKYLQTKQNSTIYTYINPKTEMVMCRRERPRVFVSSTSWTADEDFSIFLEALCKLDDFLKNMPDRLYNYVLVIISGKGPMKEHYLEKIKKINFARICISTAWLTAEDYPLLLAVSDVGVSLHTSSSGLDFPMKVVDLIGTCTPALVMNFELAGERVKHGVNGLIFNNESELYDSMRKIVVVGNKELYNIPIPKGIFDDEDVDTNTNTTTDIDTDSLLNNDSLNLSLNTTVELEEPSTENNNIADKKPEKSEKSHTSSSSKRKLRKMYSLTTLRYHLLGDANNHNWHNTWMINVAPLFRNKLWKK